MHPSFIIILLPFTSLGILFFLLLLLFLFRLFMLCFLFLCWLAVLLFLFKRLFFGIALLFLNFALFIFSLDFHWLFSLFAFFVVPQRFLLGLVTFFFFFLFSCISFFYIFSFLTLLSLCIFAFRPSRFAFIWSLVERLLSMGFARYVTYTSPILKHLFVLSAQLDVEAPGQDLAVVAVADEVDGVDLHLQHHLEGAWVVVLDFDEAELWEGLLHILLSGVEVAFDEISR